MQYDGVWSSQWRTRISHLRIHRSIFPTGIRNIQALIPPQLPSLGICLQACLWLRLQPCKWRQVRTPKYPMLIVVARYPSAGGQYQFVAELSPPSIRAGISWYCGWFTVLGWHAFTASAPFGAANLTLGLISLNHPNFVAKAWHNSCIYWGITLIALGFNLWGNRILPQIQNAILAFHIGFFFMVFIAMLALKPDANTAAFVFTKFQNSTGWSSDGIAWCLGMLTSCYVMIGTSSNPPSIRSSHDFSPLKATIQQHTCRKKFQIQHATFPAPWYFRLGSTD